MTARVLAIYLFTCVFMFCGCDQPQANKISPTKAIHPELKEGLFNVAFLIMDGVYNTELTAPFDIFHHTIFRDSIKAMNVFTVSKESGYVKTFEGIHIVPDFNYQTDSLPPIDILIVPSAEHHMDSDLEDEVMLDFVSQTA